MDRRKGFLLSPLDLHLFVFDKLDFRKLQLVSADDQLMGWRIVLVADARLYGSKDELALVGVEAVIT